MKIHTNKYGRELRVYLGKTIYLINMNGAIGYATTNEDLWDRGWRIGFTSISRFISPLGIYLFKATL